MTDTAPQKPQKKKETFGEMMGSLATMIILALVFRSLAFEPFHIPSGSMLSTLYEGDYIFVNKFALGYSRYSFPFAPDLFDGRILETMPKRGDVLVFRNPANTHIDYIKRLVGMPGDTVQMKRGRLYINGEMVDQTRDGEVSLPGECGQEHQVARYQETLPGGLKHVVLDDSSTLDDPHNSCEPEKKRREEIVAGRQLDPDNTPLYTVPEGHLFMMGDNRDHSQDSRFAPEMGYLGAPSYVPIENIVGRAEIIALSLRGKDGRWFKKI